MLSCCSSNFNFSASALNSCRKVSVSINFTAKLVFCNTKGTFYRLRVRGPVLAAGVATSAHVPLTLMALLVDTSVVRMVSSGLDHYRFLASIHVSTDAEAGCCAAFCGNARQSATDVPWYVAASQLHRAASLPWLLGSGDAVHRLAHQVPEPAPMAMGLRAVLRKEQQTIHHGRPLSICFLVPKLPLPPCSCRNRIMRL